MKRIQTLVAVVGLAILGGVAYWVQQPKSGLAVAASGTASSGTPSTGGSAATPGKSPAPGAGGANSGPVPVEVGLVQRETLVDEATSVGSLRARQTVLLKPEVSGRVIKLGFADGARVRRGQLLVQLDDALQQAQVQQAQAQLNIARTQLRRSQELQQQGFVSPQSVEQAQANQQVAEAQLSLAQAQLARMQVKAPFDGVAGIRQVNLGDYVKDGTELVSVEDASSMWVDFRLPERYVPRLRQGQQVQLGLDALPGQRFAAKIEALDAQLDAAGRSLLVRARLMDRSEALRSGLFARVTVALGSHKDALVVPEEALVPQGGKQYVIKLVPGPQSQGWVSERVEARLGMRLPGKVELLGGVAPGDKVVTAGQARLMRGNGLPVKLVDLDKPAGKPLAASAPQAASR